MTNQIFVSYAHKDNIFVGLLHEKLKNDFEVWIDAERLRQGENWATAIDTAIRTSFAVIVVISDNSCVSQYVTYEWSYGMGLGIPVIPLMTNGTDNQKVHPKLKDLQWSDFTGNRLPWDDLISSLRHIQTQYLSPGASEAAMMWFNLGKDQVRQNDRRNAIASFKEAIKFASPTLLDDIYFELGCIYLYLKEYEEAGNYLKKVLTHNEAHAPALFKLGTLYRRLADNASSDKERGQHLRHSVERFRDALDIDPRLLDDEQESGWGSLGGVLKRQGDLDEAIKAYKQAVAVKKGSYPYNNLGLLYMEKNDLPRMRQNFRLVERYASNKISDNPGDEWAHNDLLIAQLVLGKLQQALDSLTDVLMVGHSSAIGSLLATLDKLLKVEELPDNTKDSIEGMISTLQERLEELREEEQLF